MVCRFRGETLGCVTWLCCLIGCVIFGAIMLSTTPLFETPQYEEDLCTVTARDTRCLGLQLQQPDCRVSVDVALRSHPTCTYEELPCTDCAEAWKPKTMVQRCVYRTAKIVSEEGTGEGSLNWLAVHALNQTEKCFYHVSNSSLVQFQLPHEMELTSSDVLLAILPALFFWVSACFVLPAYMEPNSYQGRTLAKLGFLKYTKDFELRGGHVETFSAPGSDERDTMALVTKTRENFDVPSNIVMTRRDEDEDSMEQGSNARRSHNSSRRNSEIILGQSKLKEPPDLGP